MKKKTFVVDEAGKFCADERKFCNGKCVYNQILGLAYSVDQIVEVLNSADANVNINAISVIKP